MKPIVSNDTKIYFFSFKNTIIFLFPEDFKNSEGDEFESFSYIANVLPCK